MVKLLLSLFGFLLFLNSWGAEEDLDPYLPIVTKTIHGKVLLRVECTQVERQVNSLRAWTKRVDKRICSKPKQKVNYSGHCVLDITDCLPQRVSAVQDLTTEEDGPNCWNTSLVMQKLLPHLRETSFFEFESFIRSPFCREILIPQLRKPGDIGSIEAQFPDGRNTHIHSFIHINHRLIFQKLGMAQDSGFKLSSYREMHRDYPLELTGDCKKDCSPKVSFQDLLENSLHLKIENKFPALTIPDPKYFCRTFHEENKPSLAVLKEIFKEEVPTMNDTEFEEVRGILFKGCEIFQDRLRLIKGSDSVCKKMCPLPRLRYYRCEDPRNYFRKVSPRGGELYSKMDKLLSPIDDALERFFVLSLGNTQDLRATYRKIVLEIRDFLIKKNLKISKLSKIEKRALALIGIRLIESGIQIDDAGFFESQMGDYFKFSSEFANALTND